MKLFSAFKRFTFLLDSFISLDLPAIDTFTQFYNKLKFFFYKFVCLKKLFDIYFRVDIEYFPTDVEGTLYKFLIGEGFDIRDYI